MITVGEPRRDAPAMAPRLSSLTRRAVDAYASEQACPGAASSRIAKRDAALVRRRHRAAVSAAHRLAGTLGMTLQQLPPEACFACFGERPIAAFRCADLPVDLLVTSEGTSGFRGRLADPLRLLDRHGYRSRRFDSLEDLGCELVRYDRDGARFDPMTNG
jgi:hypothetical protein